MLRSIQWAALGTGFTFLMTTLGAAVVFFLTGEPKPRFQKTALGFAAGVMTAASVWSLLLPAIDQAAEAGRFPGWLPAAAGMLAGVVFLAALDALLPHLRQSPSRCGKRDYPAGKPSQAVCSPALWSRSSAFWWWGLRPGRSP